MLQTISIHVSPTGSDTVESEVNSYLDSACEPITSNPLTYWRNNKKQFKELSSIAQQYLPPQLQLSAFSA